MFVKVELFYGTQGMRERKRMIEHHQYYKTTSVKVEDTRMYIESCRESGHGREAVRESNRRR
jgi:hypothetical protein